MQTFKEMDLKPEILEALDKIGFEAPTPIQAKAIPHVLSSDQDLIAFAQTGTGKTGAFSIPILERVDIDSKKVQAIVLCPTRELCLQISKDIEGFSNKIRGFRHTAVYGGASIQDQIRNIRKGSQIIVGTPGRTVDLIKRRVLDLGEIQWVVLDEADEMLSMGFAEDLRFILGQTPEEKQTLLFSATIPPVMRRIAEEYMHDPLEINAGSKKVSQENVRHTFVLVQPNQRFDALKRLIDVHPDLYGIVFCRTRRESSEVAMRLSQSGYNADFLNGELSQAQRDQVMRRFREGRLQLLVATDIAARGLDVDELSHVFHFNLPDELDVYIHRSGRTGRAGNEGMSIALLTRRDRNRLRFLENKIGRQMEQLPVPRIDQIMRRHGVRFSQKLVEAKALPENMQEALDAVQENLKDLTKEELVERMLSLAIEDMAKEYEGSRESEINRPADFGGRDDRRDRRDRDRGNRRDRRDRDRGDRRDRDRGERGERRASRPQQDMEEFTVNLGKKQKFTPGLLLEMVNGAIDGEKPDIGDIHVHKGFTTFQMPPRFTGDVLRGLRKASFKGKSIWVEPSTESDQPSSGPIRKSKARKPGAKRQFSSRNKR
ncbi:MAG: DEAD/DEAH box helicase [Bacteroidia bacterium]